MNKWNALYKRLQSPSSSFDDLLKYLWDAHLSALKDAYKIFEDRLEYYSKPEADFGRDWCVALDYLAAACFPTTFIRISEFQKGLPPRVLVDGDKAPFISDFTDFQNTVLLGLNLLHEVDNATGRSNNLPYTGEEEAISYNGRDIRRAPWFPGGLLEYASPQLFELETCKGRSFLLSTQHTGAVLVRGLQNNH
ncbi:hypothetical protein J1605_017635 [Eschrichtius robustus]|uniref:Uncharacterized protein n=1 Tax=Eschrichtius robustus TaxID=9764 RepID=A0AB34I2F7_ESCRO|nr:hypothetical protein J1605_017635 [Eschrichtius robustus]